MALTQEKLAKIKEIWGGSSNQAQATQPQANISGAFNTFLAERQPAQTASTQEIIPQDTRGFVEKTGDIGTGFAQGATQTLTRPLRDIGGIVDTSKRLSTLQGITESSQTLNSVQQRIQQALQEIPVGDPRRAGLEDALAGGQKAQSIVSEQVKNLEQAPNQLEQITPLGGTNVFKPQNAQQGFGKGAERIAEFFAGGPKSSSVLKSAGREAVQAGSILAGQTETGNAQDTIKAGVGGAIAGASASLLGSALSPLFKKTFPKFASKLQESALRLTPAQERKLGSRANEVSNFLAKNKIAGTPAGRLSKVENLYENMEDGFQKFLKKQKGTVSRKQILGELDGVVGKYANERDILAIEKQVKGFKNLLKKRFKASIDINDLNTLKRSTFKNAYNQAGDKVLDFVEHDIGGILKDAVAKNAKGKIRIGKKVFNSVDAFNKEYGNTILARKLLSVASSRNQAGAMNRLIVSLAAGSAGASGGPVSAAVAGTVANKALGTITTPIKTSLANVFTTLSNREIQNIPPAILKIILSLLNEN